LGVWVEGLVRVVVSEILDTERRGARETQPGTALPSCHWDFVILAEPDVVGLGVLVYLSWNLGYRSG